MVDLATIGLVLAGLVLLFAGAALSVYGVILLGVIVGSGGGYLLTPTIASLIGLEGLLATGGAIAIGAVAGAVLGYVLMTFTVAALSFVVGSYLGYGLLAPIFLDGAWYVDAGFAIVVGIVAAIVATVLTKTMLIVITSVVGASFASTSLTIEKFQTAKEAVTLEPLFFDATSPLFLALLILGVLSQFGLFKLGYVAKLGKVLPGARAIADRGGEEPKSG